MGRLWLLVKIVLAAIAVVWVLSLPFVTWPSWATAVFGLVLLLGMGAMAKDARAWREKGAAAARPDVDPITGLPRPPSRG